MSASNKLKTCGLYLLTAATLCMSAGKLNNNKKYNNAINNVFSEEHKEALFEELINGKVPHDVLAKPVAKIDTANAINLDTDESGIVVVEALRDLYKKHPNDAHVNFTQNNKSYSVSAKDLIDLADIFSKQMDKIRPGFDKTMLILKQDMTNISVDFVEDEKLAMPQITTATLLYMNKSGLSAALAHEASHINDLRNPHQNKSINRKNEFRADSSAASIVSPKRFIECLKQIATAYQIENRSMPLDSMKKYLNSTRSFGFGNNEANSHPGIGRRVQYQEMYEIFQQNHELKQLKTPPEQRFTPPSSNTVLK